LVIVPTQQPTEEAKEDKGLSFETLMNLKPAEPTEAPSFNFEKFMTLTPPPETDSGGFFCSL
jgi:hypothetical protein